MIHPDKKFVCPFLIEQLKLRYRPVRAVHGDRRWRPIKIDGQDVQGKCTRGDTVSGFLCCHEAMMNLKKNGQPRHQRALVNGFIAAHTMGGHRADGVAVGLKNVLLAGVESPAVQNVVRLVTAAIPNWRPKN